MEFSMTVAYHHESGNSMGPGKPDRPIPHPSPQPGQPPDQPSEVEGYPAPSPFLKRRPRKCEFSARRYLLPKALTLRPKSIEQKATKETKALSYPGFFVLFVAFCSTKSAHF